MAGTQLKEIRVVNSYTVTIGRNILSMVGSQAAAAAKTRRALVVSDDNIPEQYTRKVSASLESEGFEVSHFVFPHGERSKCASTYIELLNFAAQKRLCRTDIMIAVGGGVTGDLTGFAAATYMRGIKYIQVPTTLLAAVDSSVGGKTGIDLEYGKNLAGAFYRPYAVICDMDTFKTLPDLFLRDGMAEVIKYAHIGEPELLELLTKRDDIYDSLKTGSNPECSAEIVARCVALKARIVDADEMESGERRLLNLGHTAGHAIEAVSNFGISHGHAVAIGMCIFARGACRLGICPDDVRDAIIKLNQKYDLPTQTDIDPQKIYTAALSDKKSSGDTVTVVLPSKTAGCVLQKIHNNQLRELIELGTEN